MTTQRSALDQAQTRGSRYLEGESNRDAATFIELTLVRPSPYLSFVLYILISSRCGDSVIFTTPRLYHSSRRLTHLA